MMLSTEATAAAAAAAAAPSPPDATTSSSQQTTRIVDGAVVVDGENDTTVEETELRVRQSHDNVAAAAATKDNEGEGGEGLSPAAYLSSSVTPAEEDEEQHEQETSCEGGNKRGINGEEEEVVSSSMEASRRGSGSGRQQGSSRKRGRRPGEEVIDEQGDDEDDMSDSLSGRGHYPDPAASLSAAAVASISSAAYPPQQHHQQSNVHMLHGHVHVGLSGSSSAAAAQHHPHRGSSSAADNTTEGEPSVSTGLSSGDPDSPMPPAQQQQHLDLTHFYEAISLMNPTERRGWDEAQARCSAAVLENECCPCYFLRANQHNPWDAAAMACAYWNERITLFRDRAFDPLTMGGNTEVHGQGMDDTAGTSTATASSEPTGLAREDVDILETGCMQLLPPDADGRSVLYLDRSLLEPHMLRQTVPRLRVLWYLFQKAYTSDGPIPHRVVVIGLVCRPPNGGYDFSFPARGMRIAAALPIQIETYHLLTLPAVSGTGRMLKTVLAVCAGMLGMYFQSQTKVHHGAAATATSASAASTSAGGGGEGEEDPHEPGPKDAESGASSSPTPDPRLQLLEKLQTYGLSKKGLPECAGGTFTLESFRNWLKRQRRIEQHNTWTGEQRSQRRREINRIHSRQKRQRRRQEFYELQDQAKALELDNDRARRVNAHLEALLYTARGLVHSSLATASHGGNPAPSAYSSMNTLSTSDASSVPPIHAPQAQRVPSHTHNPHSLQNQLQHQHDYSQMLAALEPDPIAPYHIPKTAVAAQEWGPDPIAPSCDPKASASHHQGNHSATANDDLKRLSRVLNSWHGVHSATQPPTDGLASAADSAAVYAESVPSHGTDIPSSSFPHGLQAGPHYRSSGVANSGYSASQVASASTSTYPTANESSASTVKLPTPTSTLQALFPFFYKTPTVDPTPAQHQQEEHRVPLAARVPSAAAAAASSDAGGPFGQYWTLYASGTSGDDPTSMSPAPAPNAHEDLDLSSDDPLHRLERWDDGNGGGLLSLLKTDDNDAFEPLDHRIAWDSFV